MRLLALVLAGGGCLLGSAAVWADGGDDQAAATCVTAFPYNDAGTTVGKVDNYDLPPDVAAPTLTATCAAIANGGGPAGSLPRGAVYTGTGTAPDAVYRMDFPAGNADTLTITMDPTGAQDLSLMVYCNTVSSLLDDGLVVDDTGVGGAAESVTVGQIAPGTSLYIVVDGYSTGGTPPGPSGPYTLSVTSSGTTQPAPCGAPSADLSITKDDGTASAVPGGSTEYTIIATNNGPSDVTGASIADAFPAACLTVDYVATGTGGAAGFTAAGSGDIADTVDLPSGATVTYTATCTIDPAATGTLDNTATITSATDDPDTGNNEATDSDTLDAEADLAITKTDGTGSAVPGAATTYTITATNAGPSDVAGATVADTFPATCSTVDYTAVGSGGAAGFTAAGTGNINDAVDLPAGGSVTYTATCNIAASATGTLDNTATVTSATADPDTGNNEASDSDTLDASADLSIVKIADASAIDDGVISYTIVVGSAGPSNASGAAVADLFESPLTDVEWTCVAAGGGSCTAAGTGDIADVVVLPPGGTVTYTAVADVPVPLEGAVSNTATVEAPAGVTDPELSNNSSTVTVQPIGIFADGFEEPPAP